MIYVVSQKPEVSNPSLRAFWARVLVVCTTRAGPWLHAVTGGLPCSDIPTGSLPCSVASNCKQGAGFVLLVAFVSLKWALLTGFFEEALLGCKSSSCCLESCRLPWEQGNLFAESVLHAAPSPSGRDGYRCFVFCSRG